MRPMRSFLVALIAWAAIPGPGCPAPPIEDWQAQGRAAVAAAEREKPVRRRARNVLLFVGDGMSFATVTAARIFEGQGRGEPGEENLLSFERLPYTAWVKTYNTNLQVPDSAGTMTAIVTGAKTQAERIAVDGGVGRSDFEAVAKHRLKTILEHAEERGLATGVVTTTSLTHATPAACYAHSSDRDWEDDSKLPEAAHAAGFPDIARQLVEFPYGDGLEVALGGGRGQFLPEDAPDPEEPDLRGRRRDGRDLTREWLRRKNSVYVWNLTGFTAVDPGKTGQLLGLFDPSHMEYEHDRSGDAGGEPSLAEMTVKAIDILRRNPKGFFLMVEGGRIDHAHHDGNAFRALSDTVAFARAVQAGLDRVDLRETLVIVTADHGHAFTMSGHPVRGNPILGLVRSIDAEGRPREEPARDALGRPYTTLNYVNGPGYRGIASGRPDLAGVDTASPDYLQEALVPLGGVTHTGEDVPVYAAGPMAYLVRGVQEQTYLFHVMAAALGIGPGGSGE
ncbi:MAG: alkaline phosphatase [Acidobacteria bacterium]|nr:alkaline phosphatase [Acidobacteriota bacterium]